MSTTSWTGFAAAALPGMATGGALPLQASSGFNAGDLFSTALPDLAGLQKALGDFAAYSQHARLLELQIDGLDLPWLVEHWQCSEGLNAPFVHELTLLMMQARINLDDLIGRVAHLSLLQADGSRRRFAGLVESVAQLGSDGGLARYGLSLVPATHYATLQGGSLVWQDLSVEAITDRILARYAPHIRHRWQLSNSLAPRSLCVQYDETDWQFLTRLWSEEGLSYYYEHDQSDGSGRAGGSDNSGSGHTLVLIDAEHDWPAHRAIAYGRVSSALADDRIDRLGLTHTLHPGSSVRASWDYKTLTAPAGSAADTLYPNAPVLEDYSGSGAYRYPDNDAAAAAAERAQAAYRQRMQTYQGNGAVRSLGPAHRFTLTEHADFVADFDYLVQSLGQNTNDQPPELIVLGIEHRAANNLTPGLGGTEHEPGSYRNAFSAVRSDAPIVPQRQPRPAAQTQSALVTGLADSLVDANTTERDHRIRLQFHWQRGSQPNPGGHSDAPIDDIDAASGHDTSHTWVRVAEWLAGPNWGSHFLPRIGDEVLVDFIDADPDRPLVVGSLYNPQDIPPYSAGHDSAANHAGTVSGIHSRGLDGGDYARLVFDDAQSQLRTQLKTGYQQSQLNLGHILHQPAHASQRGAWRGAGLELKTDGWAILRASLGILITTSARPGSGQYAPGSQMDSAEAIGQFTQARDLAQSLIHGAGAHGIAAHDLAPLDAYRDSLDARHDSPAGGQSTTKHPPAERTETEPAERTGQPIIQLDAPAPAIATTPGNSLHYAAQDHLTVVQGDLQHSAQSGVSQVAGGTLSLYTDQPKETGQALQIKAAHGPVSLQAHTDALELKADQTLKIVSVDDEIHITAQHRIVLTAADSQIELNGSNITFKTPGTFKAQSGGQDNAPGQGSGGTPLGLPVGQIGEVQNWIELRHTYEDLEPVQGATYKVTFRDGSVRSGTLDATGFARIEGVKAGVATVEYGEDIRPWQPPPERKNPDFGAATDETAAARLYEKYVGGKA